MTDPVFASIILYITTSITYFFYWSILNRVCNLLNKVVKGTKTRKELGAVSEEAGLNIKLSIVWPIALCRLLIKRIKN